MQQWQSLSGIPKILGSYDQRDDQPEDLTEEFVEPKYKREGVTPACEVYFNKLKTFHRGLTKFSDIAETTQKMGHSYLAAVQWMRMLWKAGRVRRFYRGIYVRGLDGHSGKKYGVHYLW